jgi:hypothetical protein
MTKLNQIIAVANGKKTGSQKSLTDIYQKLNKTELFSGRKSKNIVPRYPNMTP